MSYDSTTTKAEFDAQLNGRKVQTNQYYNGNKLLTWDGVPSRASIYVAYVFGTQGVSVIHTWDEYVAAGKPIVMPASYLLEVTSLRQLTQDDFNRGASVWEVVGTVPDPDYDKLNVTLSYSKVDVSETGLVEEGTKTITYYYKPDYYTYSAPVSYIVEMPE